MSEKKVKKNVSLKDQNHLHLRAMATLKNIFRLHWKQAITVY